MRLDSVRVDIVGVDIVRVDTVRVDTVGVDIVRVDIVRVDILQSDNGKQYSVILHSGIEVEMVGVDIGGTLQKGGSYQRG